MDFADYLNIIHEGVTIPKNISKEQSDNIKWKTNKLADMFETEVYRIITKSDLKDDGDVDSPLPLTTIYAVALENIAKDIKINKQIYDKLKKV